MSKGPAMPAVVLDNVPAHVRRNGDTTCMAFLGSKTGKEVGVCFWRVHPTQPKFTAVFKVKDSRDRWHNTSTRLADMKEKYGVVSSLVWYDRRLECVVGEAEGETKDRVRPGQSSNNIIQTETKALRKPILGNKDFRNDPREASEESYNSKTPQHSSVSGGEDFQGSVNKSPSSGFVSDSSSSYSDRGSGCVRSSKRPPVPNNSDLLRRLVNAIEAELKRRPGGGWAGEERRVAQTVADSWQADVRQLERLYEHFLGDLGMDRQTLRQELSSIYNCRGFNTVSRGEVLQLTEQFIVQAGGRAGLDLNTELLDFLSENNSKYQISKEEVLYILSRNKLDLMGTLKSFRATSRVSTFRSIIQDKVNLSGNLFKEFSQLLIDFFMFKSKEGPDGSERRISPPVTVKPVNMENNMAGLMRELQVSVDREDNNKSQSLIVEIIQRIEALPELNVLEGETARLLAELSSCRESQQERMTTANQENKMLRARSSSLQISLAEALERKDATAWKFSVFCHTLDSFLKEEDLPLPGHDGDEVTVLVSGLQKIKQTISGRKDQLGGQAVNIVFNDGNTISVFTNRSNNICLREVEKQVGRRVVSVLAPHGDEYREMKMTGGYVNCPASGWGNSVYWVKTEEHKGNFLRRIPNPRNILGIF